MSQVDQYVSSEEGIDLGVRQRFLFLSIHADIVQSWLKPYVFKH